MHIYAYAFNYGHPHYSCVHLYACVVVLVN